MPEATFWLKGAKQYNIVKELKQFFFWHAISQMVRDTQIFGMK